jgi:N-methylhydantoinase B/oxoprolinase/acetone carboxylase alpha subunit
MRSSFEYTCERMSRVLKRSAFSPLIVDMVDFSNAVADVDGNLVGQSANCPVHLGAMHFSAKVSIEKYGAENLLPGDIIVLNDPYMGGTHTNDMTLTAPVFAGDELIGFGVSRAHWTDVGGQGGGTHIAAEGLRLPPVKLADAGVMNEELISIMRASSRVPQHVDGDLRAQIGAIRAAESELQRLAERYGTDTLREAMVEVQNYTERMTRTAIGQIPDGTYRAEEYADTDGFSEKPIRLKLELRIEGDRIEVDFTGTDPMAMGAINSPLANTTSAVYYSLKAFLQPDAPPNHGMYRSIDINVPEGSWLNSQWPAPTIGCTTVAAAKVGAAVWEAMALAVPDLAIAPTNTECNWFMAAVDVGDGSQALYSELPPGGWGGTPFNDGMNATIDPLGNCTNLPIEVGELLFPVEYEAVEFLEDTGGPGRQRGGLGQRFQIRWLGDAALTMGCSRTLTGSPGVNGGEGSPPQLMSKVHPDGRKEVIGGYGADGEWKSCVIANHPFQSGESFLLEATGGGGWGVPSERDPEKVVEDVADGLISEDAAREIYRVAIADGELDAQATAALRTV